MIPNKPETDFLTLKSEMRSFPRIAMADDFAEKMHYGQTRSIKKIRYPYITHPRMVATVLFDLGYSEDIVISGLLHDVVEDCDCSIHYIKQLFNDDIAFIVEKLTNISNPEDENKKEIDRKHILSGDNRSMTIKVVDTGCNALIIEKAFSRTAALRWFENKKILLNDIQIENQELLDEVTDIIHTGIKRLSISPNIECI